MHTPFASFLIGDRDWVVPAVAALAAVALIVLFAYSRAIWPTRLRWVAGILKVIGIALLLSCLIEPLWSGTRAKPGENLFLLAVDRSASLDVRGAGARRSRAAELEAVLGDEESGWWVRLAQDFEVRRYTFDSRLKAVETYQGMTFDGAASSLRHALQTLADRFVDRPVAGVLLFTDGNATDWSADVGDLYSRLPQVYPVIVDTREAPTDVSIENIAVSETSFEDAPITMRADVRVAGGAEEEILCRLMTMEGALVEEQRQKPDADSPVLTFRFQVQPTEAGLSFYQLRAGTEEELDNFEEPDGTEEATLANNQRLVTVDREAGPHRVLYVGGRPNWDFKFLRRSVEEDAEVELVGLIRIARREAKFDFRGRAGESSNPLFRGYEGDVDEETEAYDQAVIVRLSTRDEQELKEGFPETKEALYEYDAIILDDIEAAFFKHEQLSLIEQFVSERGGGLLMLGGVDAFEGGGYDNTPLEDVLPVYVDRAVPAQPQQYRLELSREGWLEPWVRLRSTEPEEETRLVEMPGFTTLTRVRNLKPAARELAHVRDELGERHPALVVQQYGDGRAGALLLGDAWRWSLRRDPDHADDPEKSWRQTIRWLVADIPQRVTTQVERTESGESTAMAIRVTAYDDVYGPLENAAVTVTIEPPDGEPLTLDAEPSTTVPGLFETLYVPREPGAYRVEAVAVDAAGEEVGRDDTGWTSDPAATEFRVIGIDRDRLREIAEATGGQLVELDDLPAFVESLPYRTVPVTEAWTSPLWHHPWVLLLAIGCLAGEWGLRRVKGLP